jgi:hypothetical protein
LVSEDARGGFSPVSGARRADPRHWRAFPQPWPPVTGDDPALQRVLARELAGLPRTWQAVVRERDGAGRSAGEVQARLGLSGAQQRAIRNRAWAVLRERLAARLSREGGVTSGGVAADATPRALARRLRPLQVAVGLQGWRCGSRSRSCSCLRSGSMPGRWR